MSQAARFDLFLERLGRDLGAFRVEPSPAGELRFFFHGKERPFAMVLLPGAAQVRGFLSEPVAESRLVLAAKLPGSREETLLRAASSKLRGLMADPEARRWLDRRNRNVAAVPLSAEGFLGLFGNTIKPGVPFWKGWSLKKASLKKGGLLVVLGEGAGRTIELLFDPVLGKLSAAGPSVGGVEAAFAHLLAKGTHAAMRWKAPPRRRPGKRSKSAELPPSIVENCYRSGAPWRRISSRFFRVWGDSDHFGLTAAAGNYEEVSYVAHASRECVYSATVLDGRLKYHSSPWGAVSFLKPGEYARYHLTDLSDKAVISGGEERLAQAIEQVMAAAPGRRVVVSGNCDYHIIGDDIDKVCRRCSAKAGAIQHLNPPLPGFREVQSSNWWADFLGMADFSARKQKRSVNLAGLGPWDEPGVRELAELLGLCGIAVQSVILPNISPEASQRFGKASLTVLSPWLPVCDVLEKALADKGMRVIKPAVPYGVSGTKSWLKAVCSAAGGKLPEGEFERLRAERAPDYSTLRRRARGKTLTFICDVGAPRELRAPSVFFGMDLAACVKDLGFKLAILGPGAPLRGAGLVYCDVCRGAIVKAAGATPFSIDAFSIGVAGAQKTLSRLLALSDLETYTRYGGYL